MHRRRMVDSRVVRRRGIMVEDGMWRCSRLSRVMGRVGAMFTARLVDHRRIKGSEVGE